MKACEQAPGLSVFEHGEQVRDYFIDLVSHLRDGSALRFEWRLPDWLDAKVLPYLLDSDVLATYHLYHDCGKPFCVDVDAAGRRHFPAHAAVSHKVAHAHGFDACVCRLIAKDMDIHLLKDVGVEAFCSDGDAISLLLTGLAEIHANAAMFGGIESQSFKQKWKQINRRGKKIIAKIVV